MKRLAVVVFILYVSCFHKSNELESETHTLTLRYINWACDCANWIQPGDAGKYKKQDSLAAHCMFIEAAEAKASLSDSLCQNGVVVEFTGQFYKNKGFSRDFIKTEESVYAAKIFRYTRFRVIKRHNED